MKCILWSDYLRFYPYYRLFTVVVITKVTIVYSLTGVVVRAISDAISITDLRANFQIQFMIILSNHKLITKNTQVKKFNLTNCCHVTKIVLYI